MKRAVSTTVVPPGLNKFTALLGLCVIGMLLANLARAEFAMNWTELGHDSNNKYKWVNEVCNRPPAGDVNCWGDGNHWGMADDTTPMLMEVVSDGTYRYYHTIIGLPTDNFAQETFIRFGSVLAAYNSDPVYNSASTSNGNDFLNANNPLSSTADNGSGTPKLVTIQQINNDPAEGFTQEFMKATYLNKPKITQNLVNAEINSQTIIDMTAGNYDVAAPIAAGSFTNTFILSTMPDNSADFDMATDAQDSSLNAGAYTYIWNAAYPSTGEGGTYSYTNASYDPNTVNWIDYCVPAQNPVTPCQ